MDKFLIERLQNFTLNRKIFSVDSGDRDINKWPSSSEFEVTCPQDYNKVESIRLVTLQTPNIFYNISEYLQNNKLVIEYKNDSADNDISLITLDDGFYTYNTLTSELKSKLQLVNSNFDVTFNDLTKKITITNNTSSFSFSLNFNKRITYTTNDTVSINCKFNNYVDIFKQHSNWGLGAILGFDKKLYTSEYISPNNTIVSPKIVNLDDYQYIYIEADKLNNADEIKPYLIDKINNTNSGIVNSFFAKVPIMKSNHNQSINNKECYIEGVSYYQPPLEKISKLKFRFRYHNGLLVDFQNFNLSLTLEINMIRNEIKKYDVRTPFLL